MPLERRSDLGLPTKAAAWLSDGAGLKAKLPVIWYGMAPRLL